MSHDHRKASRYNQQFFRDWGGPGPLFFGLLAVLLVVIGTYLAFTKTIPFTSPGYEIKATFNDAVNIAVKSPVRIAGINVGEVTEMESKGDNTVVTFTVDDSGRPIREDAAAQIRPRLFLEGNWFIDLDPGTPDSPELEDDGEIPVSRTSTSVQVGQILTTLQTPERANIQRLLEGLGTGLNRKPTPAEDVTFEPMVQGLSGGEALNLAYREGADASRGTAIVNEAYLGEAPNDLGNLLRGLARVTGAVNERGDDLTGFVQNYTTFVGALAAEQENLGLTIQELGPTLQTARVSLASLNDSLPALRGFAVAIRPGINELPRTIRVTKPLLNQLQKLLTKRELGGLAQTLRKITPDAAASTNSLVQLLPQLRYFGLCLADTLVPSGEQVIEDGSFSNGQKASREFLYAAVGVAGESQNFDGNGRYIKVLPGGGDLNVGTSDPGAGSDTNVSQLYGPASTPTLGTKPAGASLPPLDASQRCYTQEPADLNGPQATSAGPDPVVIP
ncbi:MAG TPA: MlaD family protein [Solirubrobacterales bacterium]|nr:MlaD family protein [Solirubrobacterales bacterium]